MKLKKLVQHVFMSAFVVALRDLFFMLTELHVQVCLFLCKLSTIFGRDQLLFARLYYMCIILSLRQSTVRTCWYFDTVVFVTEKASYL